MDSGYVLAHRSLLECQDLTSKSYCEHFAWIWMIMRAMHMDTKTTFRGRVVTLKRGQFAYTVRSLAEEWGWSKSTVQRFLCKLENGTMIGTQDGTHFSVCTILKYNDFQHVHNSTVGHGVGQVAGQRWDSSGTQKNECNELKEESLKRQQSIFDPSPDAPAEPSLMTKGPVEDDRSDEPRGRGSDAAGSDAASSRKTRRTERSASDPTKGTRCPWQSGIDIPQDLRQFATSLGVDPDEAADEFADYWRGVVGYRGRKLDWPATFRNRCREIAGRRRGGASPRKSGAQLAFEAALAADERAAGRTAGAPGCVDENAAGDGGGAWDSADCVPRKAAGIRW